MGTVRLLEHGAKIWMGKIGELRWDRYADQFMRLIKKGEEVDLNNYDDYFVE